jgi:hypothetical protein
LLTLPPEKAKRGAGPRRKINFLIGIARRRHHSQVRNSPWTTFFNGVKSTKNFSAAPPRIQTSTASFQRHRRAGDPSLFFKSRLGFGIFLRMVGTRLQAREAKLVQPFADRDLMHLHREPPCHHGLQVDAPPADHMVSRRIGSLDHQFAQLDLLLLCQSGRAVAIATGFQAVDTSGVVAMHPIAQGLSIHPVEGSRLATRMAIKNQCQRQKTADLRSIGTLARKPSKVSTCDIESELCPVGNPPRESELTQVGIIARGGIALLGSAIDMPADRTHLVRRRVDILTRPSPQAKMV